MLQKITIEKKKSTEKRGGRKGKKEAKKEASL